MNCIWIKEGTELHKKYVDNKEVLPLKANGPEFWRPYLKTGQYTVDKYYSKEIKGHIRVEPKRDFYTY